MSPTHRFTVPEALAGTRLDRCLVELHADWSRARVRRLIDDGRVLVNRELAKPSTAISAGDLLEVDEPPVQPLDVTPEPIPLDVVFEDDELLVINKPAGLVIHPAAGRSSGTLVNALLQHCDDLSGIGGIERPGIVHRLDRDTSGVMVVAKTERAHLALSLAFQRRQVEKIYLAVCYGCPRDEQGVIEAPIGRHPRHRKQMAVIPAGRAARTLYWVAERYVQTSMIRCRPITGRTHQIRVHMAHIGHALIGDPMYAGRQWRTLTDRQHRVVCRDFPRQALHAFSLAFVHPVTGREVSFEAPPPADYQQLISTLRAI